MNKLKTAVLCLISLVLTGCTSPNFSVEGLVDAPKLTEEQSQIHEALTKSVGSNITLKYPRNGDYRSAYVIANIDDEPDNEAIVFYEYKETNKEKGMKINILDTDEDGEWFSVKEVSGAGTDVDKVIVSQLGSGSDINVVIGYMNQSADEKTMEVYSYKDDDFKKIGTDTYSVLEAMDFDNNGRNDLVAIQKTVNAETEKITAKASLLKLEKGEIKREMTIDMLDNVESYVKVTRGLLADGRHALFIDGSTSDGNIQTELLYYRYSTLQNPVQQRKEKLLSACPERKKNQPEHIFMHHLPAFFEKFWNTHRRIVKMKLEHENKANQNEKSKNKKHSQENCDKKKHVYCHCRYNFRLVSNLACILKRRNIWHRKDKIRIYFLENNFCGESGNQRKNGN